MNEALAQISRKVADLRRLSETEGLNVRVVEAGPTEAVEGVPADVTAVFSTFSLLEGSYLRFLRPDSIVSARAWEERPLDPDCPFGNPLDIGFLHVDMPDDIPDFDGEPLLRLDTETWDVYCLDGDAYVYYYKHPDIEETESVDIADNVVEFFNDCVLGPRYPELVEKTMGAELAARRDRKGNYKDTWRTLLERGGLI